MKTQKIVRVLVNNKTCLSITFEKLRSDSLSKLLKVLERYGCERIYWNIKHNSDKFTVRVFRKLKGENPSENELKKFKGMVKVINSNL